jgi:hypothetical protein
MYHGLQAVQLAMYFSSILHKPLNPGVKNLANETAVQGFKIHIPVK